MLVEYDPMPIRLFLSILNPASENTYYHQIIFMYPETLLVKYNIILDHLVIWFDICSRCYQIFKTFYFLSL